MPPTSVHRRALATAAAVLTAMVLLGVTAAPAAAGTGPAPTSSPWTTGVRAVAEVLAVVVDQAEVGERAPAPEQSEPVQQPAAAPPPPAPAGPPPPPPSCAESVPADADLGTMVAAIFGCRLAEAGIGGEDARRTVAEALVVAGCESEWDPSAVVFDGRYVRSPHPNGNRYTAAGSFQLIERVADRWVDGGYANVLDPRRNIDAAARLHLHTRAAGFRGWEDWACVAVSDGFADDSVLPGWPGGPAALPDWAWEIADAR